MSMAGMREEMDRNDWRVTFNQDLSCLIVLTKTGYRLFSLNSLSSLETIFEYDGEEMLLIERLFSSSLVAVVGAASPNKLCLRHFNKATEICTYSYADNIVGVKLNRLRLIVCLAESLFIHNIRDMKVLHTIRDTPPNSLGVFALAPNNETSYLAYPGSSQTGEVHIFDTINLRAVSTICAHDSRLVALDFNSQGNWIATASEKGTVIRVFSVIDGLKLFEFRRGVKRCAAICSLAFSTDSLYLSCSSNTETVHVFKLDTGSDKPADEAQSWYGYFGNALKSSAHYLPTQFSEVLTQGRYFAVARLPFSGIKSVCAVTVVQAAPRLLVGAYDGTLSVYNLDSALGGECKLLVQHRIDGLVEAVCPPARRRQASSSSSSCSGGGQNSRLDVTAPLSGAGSRNSSAGDLCLQWADPPRKSYASVVQTSPTPRDGPQNEPTIESPIADSEDIVTWEDAVSCEPDCTANTSSGELQIADSNEFPAISVGYLSNGHQVQG